MRVDLRTKVKNYDGKDLPQTYLDLMTTALNGIDPSERVTAETKTRIFQLSKKLYASNEVTITVKEAAFIIERGEKVLSSPLALGRLKELLDPESVKDEETLSNGASGDAEKEPAGGGGNGN